MRIRKIYNLLVIVSLVILIFLLVYRSARVRKIVVVSRVSEVKGLRYLNSTNLLTLNEEEIQKEILKNNPNLKNINIKKKFPNTVYLFLVWRDAKAKVIANNSTIYIDNVGFPSLPPQNIEENLPDIHLNKIILSDIPDWRLNKIVTIINEMNNLNLHFSKIYVNEQSSQITGMIDDSIEIIIPFEANPQEISASLQTIISRFRIEGKFISKIDFRYTSPIVVLKSE